jgi:predicted negative regulator of RcsB-dependent stress response
VNLEQAMSLLGPAVGIVAELVRQIIASVQMTDEQKREALKILSADLDATVARVKSVRFDAISEGNKAP